VLFRAVEYCKWLEEGYEALRHEVESEDYGRLWKRGSGIPVPGGGKQ